MCGISGWFLKRGQSRDESQLEAASGAISHRGPDDYGIFVDREQGIALAHNRLSIIDLSSAGHQPMISDDGNFVLNYNGELYNFLEIKKELQSLGHQFHSRTDSRSCPAQFHGVGSASASIVSAACLLCALVSQIRQAVSGARSAGNEAALLHSTSW